MIRTFGHPEAPCVLVVDDERDVLTSLADLLRKEFNVIVTDDPDEAGVLLGTNAIAVLLTDQRMPRTSGTKLLALCSRISPFTTRILLTGYSDLEAVIESVNEGAIFYYVSKPWHSDKLLNVVRSAVNKNFHDQAGATLIRRLSEEGKVQPRAEEQAPIAEQSPPGAQHVEVPNRAVASFNQAVTVLEMLRVVVPVCMHCHKVQTAEGEWQEMFDYLARRSTILSHGLCPDCNQPVATGGRGLAGGHDDARTDPK